MVRRRKYSRQKKTVRVVGALIAKKGLVLLAQRFADDRYGLMWEFPGGKIESGEKPEQALRREMKEELGVDVEVRDLITSYEDTAKDLKIRVSLYNCRIVNGEPLALECRNFRWFNYQQIRRLKLAPADRKAFRFLTQTEKEKLA